MPGEVDDAGDGEGRRHSQELGGGGHGETQGDELGEPAGRSPPDQRRERDAPCTAGVVSIAPVALLAPTAEAPIEALAQLGEALLQARAHRRRGDALGPGDRRGGAAVEVASEDRRAQGLPQARELLDQDALGLQTLDGIVDRDRGPGLRCVEPELGACVAPPLPGEPAHDEGEPAPRDGSGAPRPREEREGCFLGDVVRLPGVPDQVGGEAPRPGEVEDELGFEGARRGRSHGRSTDSTTGRSDGQACGKVSAPPAPPQPAGLPRLAFDRVRPIARPELNGPGSDPRHCTARCSAPPGPIGSARPGRRGPDRWGSRRCGWPCARRCSRCSR